MTIKISGSEPRKKSVSSMRHSLRLAAPLAVERSVEHKEYPLNSKLDAKSRAKLRRKVEAATRQPTQHSAIFEPLTCEEIHLGKRVFLFHDLIGMPSVALLGGLSVRRAESVVQEFPAPDENTDK